MTLAVAYVALAGPGLYFFWKQRGMRQYYQLSVGILSLDVYKRQSQYRNWKDPFLPWHTGLVEEGKSGCLEISSYGNDGWI